MFVNESGEWVLGGLELLTIYDQADTFISKYGMLVPTSKKYCSPEVAHTGWGTVKGVPVHAVDSWQVGVLIYEAFNGLLSDPRTEMKTRGKVPANMWSAQKSLANANPKQRLTSERFLSSQAMRSPLVDLSSQLHGLSIQEEMVFSHFLDTLKDTEDKFPRAYLHAKVLPELISCLDHGKGGTRTLTCIIQISKDMAPEAYKTKVLPVILKMFGSNDRAVRMELLQGLPEYIEYLDKRVVSDKIYPALSTGFTDTEPAIREQTVKSVLSIGPKLYDRQLNGDLLRQLAKTQNDAQQEIRANTTILLGKIAPLFNQNTRVTVLVTAFNRALKDPFVPSRLAALMALASTAEYFGPQETCGKILGTVAPALIDKDKTVRTEATKTMSIFMNKVQEHISSMEKDETDSPADATANGWGGWTATIAAGLGKKMVPSNTPGPDSESTNVSRTVTPSRFDSPVPQASSRRAPVPVATAAAIPADDDGWGAGNDDTWGDDGELEFDDDDDNDSGIPIQPTSVSTVKTTPLVTKRPTFGASSNTAAKPTPAKPAAAPARKVAPRPAPKPAAAPITVDAEDDDEVEDGWGDEWGEI